MSLSLSRKHALGVLPGILLCCVLGQLAGCGSSSRGAPGGVGTGVGVSLTTPNSATVLAAGGTLAITATVSGDTNTSGVTWQLFGDGTLTDTTSTTVTYNAPATVSGALKAVIQATSVADTTKLSSVTLLVNGDPLFSPPAFFPANVNTAYSASLTVVGGTAPFTWALASGSTLPAGLTLGTGTASINAISGTPTTEGSYGFDVQVTDSASPANTISTHVDMLVNPASACVLQGRFAFMHTGVVLGVEATYGGSLDISGDTIAGVLDHKQADTTDSAASVTGTCTILSTNSGTLELNAGGGTPKFTYAVNLPLTRGRMQLISGGSTDTGSGLFERQDPAAFSLAALAGNFAFGVLGGAADGSPMALAGQLTVAADGSVLGAIDGNGGTPLANATVTGTMSAPDIASGRGTLNLSAGGQQIALVYYVIGADRLYLLGADSAGTGARLSGFASRQSGSFDATALDSPAILSLWGSAHMATPTAVMSLARLSNASSSAGTVDLLLDTFDRISNTLSQALTGASVSVAATGRVTIDANSASGARHFVAYLDGPSNGYVVETGSPYGAGGLLEVQTVVAPTGTMDGFLLLGTQHAEGSGPLVLLAAAALDTGSLGASAASGAFAVDAQTGRGIGTMTITAVGIGAAVLYQISPDKTVIMRAGSPSANATLNWLQD